MREVTIHTMDYIDAATAGILSPHVLPIDDLREMLSHIEGNTSFHHAPTNFIRRCTPFLQDTYAPTS